MLSVDEVDAYAVGCAALGSGGGGSVGTATHLVRSPLAHTGPITPTPLAEVGYDSVVALVGAVGSPTVMAERLVSGPEFALALTRVEDALGRRIDAVAPLEIGGVNGVLGLVAALVAGRPLVDADGMGRAYPRLDHCVMTQVATNSPLALADPSGGSVVLQDVDPSALGRTVLGVLPALGAWAALAGYAASAERYAVHAVPGSVTRALRVGRALVERTQNDEVRMHGNGTVLEVARSTDPRPRGVVTIGLSAPADATARIDHAEEFVTLVIDGEPIAWAPDIVTVVDARTWRPIGVGEISVGERVELLSIPAPDHLRHREIHGLMGYGFHELINGMAR